MRTSPPPAAEGHPAASADGVQEEVVRPGAISALLQELVRGPETPAPAWETGLAPGAVVGRFELVRELGRGGFGVVYEARDTALGRAVAFKALRVSGTPGGHEERLLREAEAAARLAHPNIVTLHDVGQSEHGPYLVLELLRGRTLAERLGQGPLSVREALRIALEVARGLAHAHAHGVIHRDLTPGNVFLCEDGQVKILDLGMAHAFGRRKVEGGTPAYMAPEQGRGAPEDERTDVFALGVLLHRMLAGELPWREGAGRAGRAAPALEIRELPALGPLVARMLAQDPVARPRDAAVVLEALAACREELSRTPATPRALTVRRRRSGAWKVALTLAAGLVVGAAVAALLTGRQAAAPVTPSPPSVAVLPFADLSPGQDQEYFSDGLAEEILNALAQVDGLHVSGRSSSFAFKGRGEDLRAIGERLGVGAVLEGSVRKAGNRVRITAQLVKLPEGYHLWSEGFDRELDDVFAVQDEIARAVVAALKVKLLPGRGPLSAQEHRPASTEAYAAYLLARQAHAEYSEDGFRRAAAAYERALALDPSYAPAWAGLSIPLHYDAEMERDPAARAAKRQKALVAAEKAVALDPGLAEGYSARAWLRGAVKWDWPGAQADIERALALNPNDPTTLRRYGLLRVILGRPEEALAPTRRAVDLDPLFPSNWMALAMLELGAGRFPEARSALRRVQELAPNYAGVGWSVGQLELLEGHPDQALTTFRALPDGADRLLGETLAQHALGKDREARRALAELAARHGEARPCMVAGGYAAIGDLDQAFAWLDRALAVRDPELVNLPGEVHLTRELKRDPRYAALLRAIGLPQS